jgi:prepilin-type N-terminal cleavage/methylation domain-containing protein
MATMFARMTGATFTHEMNLARPTQSRAFTLLELLVVIAIMVVIAGLVVGLSAVASEKKKIGRAQAERDKLVTLIEAYKAKVGVYPPDNRKIPFDPARNSLLYELAGAKREIGGNYSAGNPGYVTPFGNITSNDLFNAFGIEGMINASDDITDLDRRLVNRLLRNLKPDQTDVVAPNARGFVFPAEGPDGTPNKWKYAAGTNAVHNPESFDLWIDISARGKTNFNCTNCITIGNWKD